MLSKRPVILVALSGGPDSVALLHLAKDAATLFGYTIAAAHVNYGLRGKESDKDEEFCAEMCKKLEIKLHVKHASKREMKGGNLQDQARRIRYDFFQSLCDLHRFTHIATGHNQSDNVETILMNLCRGSGTFGLTGISQRSGRIIRPLLDFTRHDIEEYLASNKIKYRIDRSNLEGKYTRNKVRQRVTPILQEVFGESVFDNISRSSRIFLEHEEYLRSVAKKHLKRDATVTPFGKIVIDLARFRRYHILLKRLMLAMCFEQITGSLQGFDLAASERLLSLIKGNAGVCDLKANLFAEIANDHLCIYRKERHNPMYKVSIVQGTELEIFSLTLLAEKMSIENVDEKELRKGRNRRVYLDGRKLGSALTVRNLRVGDRFAPLGMTGSRRLSDFFSDRKIDRPLREEIPLLVRGDKVAWVVGYEIADWAKITNDTTEVLKLEVRPNRST